MNPAFQMPRQSQLPHPKPMYMADRKPRKLVHKVDGALNAEPTIGPAQAARRPRQCAPQASSVSV